MNFFWWKEKPLRTIWKVEKAGRISFLVGTAHFSPYSFKKSLTRLIQDAEIVLFEGPLDEESMARVVHYGQEGGNSPSLYKSLQSAAIKEINRQLSTQPGASKTAGSYLEMLRPTVSDPLEGAHWLGRNGQVVDVLVPVGRYFGGLNRLIHGCDRNTGDD